MAEYTSGLLGQTNWRQNTTDVAYLIFIINKLDVDPRRGDDASPMSS